MQSPGLSLAAMWAGGLILPIASNFFGFKRYGLFALHAINVHGYGLFLPLTALDASPLKTVPASF
jgi:hypothetical protein